jgi:uncharacterized protein YjiS (DUF1127 family)
MAFAGRKRFDMNIHALRAPFGLLCRSLLRDRPRRRARPATLDHLDDRLLADIGWSRVAGGIDYRRRTEI